MFENENQEEQLQSTDASPESSSETPQAAEPNAESTDKPVETAQKELPFHEHPRWKEVINERNQFATKVQELERRFEDLSRQRTESTPAQKQVENKLIERLKGIDPEFAQWAEQQEALKNQMSQVMQDLHSQRAQSQQEQARTMFEQLNAEHKVPKELQGFYQAALVNAANSNPKLGIKDLPNLYKEVHSGMQKYLDTYKRDALAEYSKGKTKDSIPAQTRSTPAPKAPSSQKRQAPIDHEDLMASIRDEAAKRMRSSRNA